MTKPCRSRPWSSSPASADRPSGYGVQPGRFRRQIRPRGVGAAHDQSEPRQRRFALQTEQLQQSVEAAALALVRNFDIGDVEGNAAEFESGRFDIVGIDEQKPGVGIDEAR